MTSQEDSDDDYLDDPIQLIDFEQRRISNQFDINTEEYDQADSEGELYIQKSNNNIQKNSFGNQSARTSITLPVNFFDITQNVEYLNNCRPLFVKIVDCDKHPWYYKKYLRSNKKRDNEFIDVDVENYVLPNRNESNCLKKCVNAEDMHYQQSKLKIRPVETPYEGLKNAYGIAISGSPNSDIPLKDWQKVIKQKALDQRNELQVDFRKNLGLIGLKISHTIKPIKAPEKKHYSKKDKVKSKAKNKDVKSKKDVIDTKTKRVEHANILKDNDHINKTQLVEKQNNGTTSVKLTPPDYIEQPPSSHTTAAEKTLSSTFKVSNSVNLTATHSGFVIPKKVGQENLGKLPESIVTPANNYPKTVSIPTGLKKIATSSTLSKSQVADKPCKPLQSNDETLAVSVSDSLPKIPNLIATSAKTLPKLSERVNVTPVEITSSSSQPKPSECMRASNITDENNLILVKSHFFSGEQCQEQNNRINEKLKSLKYKDQQIISTTDSRSAKSNEKNKTLISLLNRKMLNYNDTHKTKPINRIVSKNKTKKSPVKKKADKSIISGDKKSNILLNTKFSKYQKNSNKIDPKRFTKFNETLLKIKKQKCLSYEGTQTKETFLNGKNNKMEKSHLSNAAVSEPAVLEEEKKQKQVDPATKATPANDHKINVISARLVNKAEIDDIVSKCKTRKMREIKDGFKFNLASPLSSVAEICKPLNPAEIVTLRPDSEACQTAVNYSQKTTKYNTAPSSFQIPRDKLPVILNKLQGPWVPTSQMSVPRNNSDTNNNLKQNLHNGQKCSKMSHINVTISASPTVLQAALTSTAEQMSMNDNIKLPDNGNVTTEQQRQALKSSLVMKMGENVNIPCHLNTPPKNKKNGKMIAARRKSVPAFGENKNLEVYGNMMRLSNNFTPDKATPQRIFRPASTINPNVPLNQTIYASSPANLKQYNPNSACDPIQTLIPSNINIQGKYEVNFQPGVNKEASHLRNSQILSNFNTAAQQIKSQSRKSQQFYLGKLGALQQNRNATNRQSSGQSTQPKTQPNGVTQNQLVDRLWIGDPRQRCIQRQLPPTCDIAPPLVVNNFQHPNKSLHPETTLKPSNFTMPAPREPGNQIPNQKIVNNSHNPNEYLHPQMPLMPQSLNVPSIVPLDQAFEQVLVNNSQHTNKPIPVQMTLKPPNFSMPPPSVPRQQTPKQRTVNNAGRPNEPMDPQTNLKPPNFDTPTPNVPAKQGMVNTRDPNEPLYSQTTLTPPNFIVLPPSTLGNQGSNKGKVPQPIPVIQRDIQPGYRLDMHPHLLSNNFPAGSQNYQPVQHPAYSQQFIHQDRRIDYSNNRHCAPYYDGVPKNLDMNTIAYNMHGAWNRYYPNMMMPLPQAPCPPQHNLNQKSRCIFNGPNQTHYQLPQSVTGKTVIGYNDTGLVRKINIHAATTDTNDKRDTVNPAICRKNIGTGGVPLEPDNEPVTSKKEMMEELTRATAVISPPRSPVKEVLKYCSENVIYLNSTNNDTSPVIQVSSPNIPTVKDKSKNMSPKNARSPTSLEKTISESNTIPENLTPKELSVHKNTMHSLRGNASLSQAPNSNKREKSNEQILNSSVLNTESKKPSSPSKIDGSVNNEISSSLTVSHKNDLKRRHPQHYDISETATSQTFIKRSKPGPLSRKLHYASLFTEQTSDDGSPVAHKGYSPPILPIPTYTKSLEILAKSNQFETECRMDLAENHLKEPEINKTLRSSQASKEVSRNNLAEEKEQQEKATKKISLDEYKKRDLKSDNRNDGTVTQIKHGVKSENHDQDLGYDSDSTMRL